LTEPPPAPHAEPARQHWQRSAPSLHDLLSESPLNRLEFGSESIRSPVREVDISSET